MMFLKKRYFWLVFLLFSFTMTGCYSIHVEQYLSQDGSGSIEITYDFSEMGQMMAMMGDMPDEDLDEEFGDEMGFDLDELCEEFYEEDFLLDDRECVVLDEYIMVISGSIPVGSIEILDDEDKYGFLLKDVYKFLGPISEDGFEEMNDEEVLLSEEMDVTMTLTVTFDGDVVESDVGDYDGNQLYIDFFELARAENPMAWALKEGTGQTNGAENGNGEGDAPPLNGFEEEDDSNNMIIIIMSAVILLGVVFLIILKTKKKGSVPEAPKKEEPFSQKKETQEQKTDFGFQDKGLSQQTQSQEVSPKIQKIIDWIKKYEGQTSEENLRKNLENNPEITSEEIDIAFKNK